MHGFKNTPLTFEEEEPLIVFVCEYSERLGIFRCESNQYTFAVARETKISHRPDDE